MSRLKRAKNPIKAKFPNNVDFTLKNNLISMLTFNKIETPINPELLGPWPVGGYETLRRVH